MTENNEILETGCCGMNSKKCQCSSENPVDSQTECCDPTECEEVKTVKPKTKCKKAIASTIATPSPAAKYSSPPIHRVLIQVEVEDECFIPQFRTQDSSCVDLKANLPENHAGLKQVTLPHRSIAVIDTGIAIKMREGYHAFIKVSPELAAKGVIATESPQIIEPSDGRVVITIANIGKEIIVINHKDVVAQMYIEPIYKFNFFSEG